MSKFFDWERAMKTSGSSQIAGKTEKLTPLQQEHYDYISRSIKSEYDMFKWVLGLPKSPSNAATPQATHITPSHGALDGKRPDRVPDDEVSFKDGIMDWRNRRIAATPPTWTDLGYANFE